MIPKLLESIRPALLPSISAFSAAWMVMLATRYFSLQAADINGALLVGADTGSWLSTAYAVTEVVGVVVGAWLGIGLTLRRTLLLGVSVYLFGSLIPLMLPSYGSLMASRIITGLAGGTIMPQSIVIQLRAWPAPRTPIGMALYLSAPTAAPLLGGAIGGWGVEHFGWSAVLWAAFPPGLISLVSGHFGLRREPINWRAIVDGDLTGFITLGFALGFLFCAISQGERLRWFETPMIPILFSSSALCLAMFILRDWRRIRHPALWVKLYGRWNIALTAIGAIPLTLAISFSGVIVPSALAQLRGFRPEQIAPVLWTALWPQVPSYALCVYLLIKKLVEVRTLLVIGLCTVAAGAFFDLEIDSQWELGEFYAGQLIQGIGLPFIALPLIDHFIGDLRSPREGLPGAAVFNLSRVLGGAISTAWATTSIRLSSEGKFGELLANTGLYPDGRGSWLATVGRHTAFQDPDPLRASVGAVQVLAISARRQAAALGISDTVIALGWLLFGTCLLVVLMAEFGWGKTVHEHGRRQ